MKCHGGTGRWTAVAVVLAAALTAVSPPATAAAATVSGRITTIAGGLGTGGPLDVAVRPRWVATRGPLVYVSDDANYVVRAWDTITGDQRVVAGNGTAGSSGDGGPATSAQLTPGGLALDSVGNLFVTDVVAHRVRKVDIAGRITGFAGTGVGGFLGDGGPATKAQFSSPADIAFDAVGNLFIADSGNQRIRRVDLLGTVTTVAGNGGRGNAGDGGPALAAQLDAPSMVAVSPLGEIYLPGQSRVRKVGLTGVITTIAGTGQEGTSGDGGPATLARLEGPAALELDGAGNLYLSVYGKVRRIDPLGTITTVAGNRSLTFSGDGGPATQAGIRPVGLARDTVGNLYIADEGNSRVRRVGLDGVISTVAGNGTRGFSGAGGPATTAQIGGPWSGLSVTAVDGVGNVYVGSYGSVLRIDTGGVLTVVAGDPGGNLGFGGDGGPATAARLDYVSALAIDGAGNLFVADSGNARIRKVDASGTITTVAGSGVAGFSGDGGPATQAQLNSPNGVTVDGAGNLFIADSENQRVRWVDTAGTIATFAGTTRGVSGDGGPATQAQLSYPATLAIDPTGSLWVLSFIEGGLRRISPGGTITSVSIAGMSPYGMALDAAGKVYLADNHLTIEHLADPIQPRIRRLTPTGWTVVAGTGIEGFSGDGGAATAAQLSRPRGMAFDSAGNLYVVDSGNGKVRQIAGVGPVVDAAVRSWGLNNAGQLGRDPAPASIPVGVPGIAGTVAVRSGTAHSLALGTDGTLTAWGYNAKGQLGNDSTVDSARPVPVVGPSGVRAIGTGFLHSLAVRDDGSVVAWGWNAYGQLGTGSKTDSPVPVPSSGLTDVVAVAGGATHSLALKADGTVWAWGLNHVGQLGIGTPAESRVPVAVPGLGGVVAIAAGAFHSVALKADGTVWTWGWDVFGQLGIGQTTDRRAPVQVSGLSGVTGIAAGAYHSLAVKGDGTVWGFGLNHLHQLGPGPIVRLSPVQVAGLAGVRQVAAGAFHSLAVTTGGTALAWGFNAYGQLGDGTTVDRANPVPVVALRNVVDLAGGAGHTLAATGTPAAA